MKKILIIGGGNMGFAIAKGITDKKFLKAQDIVFIEKSLDRVRFLKSAKFTVFKDFTDLDFKNIRTIIIAVKPKDIKELLEELNKNIPNKTLVLSIAAGIKIKALSKTLKENPIGRIMPNTPCQIGEGVSVITFNKKANLKHKRTTKLIFSAIGEVLELNEDKFDLVTALSGSGPAYFAYLIEALIRSSIKLGLDEKTSSVLSIMTGLGTTKMLKEIKDLSPKRLREMVTSPNGTTHAAITTLQKYKFEDVIYKAIKAARDRAEEMGR